MTIDSDASPRFHLYVRASVFYLVLACATVIYAFVLLASYVLPQHMRYRIALSWVSLILGTLRRVCRLSYRVRYDCEFDSQAMVVFSKHSSTWETIALAALLPQQTWVLKRELMWIPFFGWGLAALGPIAINRSAGQSAVQQVVTQGGKKLSRGVWVVIFPEGTRVPLGQTKRYKMGGAILAQKTQHQIVPIAHDAGRYWPRNGFIKWPGEIQVRVGAPISTVGLSPAQINALVGTWMDQAMAELTNS